MHHPGVHVFKDIRQAPAINALQKAVGAKYLVRSGSPKQTTGSDAATAEETFSPLKDMVSKAEWPHSQAPATTRAAAHDAPPGKPRAQSPNRDPGGPLAKGLAPTPAGHLAAPPAMPQNLTPALAPAAPTGPQRGLRQQAKSRSLSDGLAPHPRPVPAAARRIIQLDDLRQMAPVRVGQAGQRGTPGDCPAPVNPPISPVPVFDAVHIDGTVLGPDGQVRLRHGRQATAQGSFGRFYRAITADGQLRGLKEINVASLQESGLDGLQPTSRRALFDEVHSMLRLGMHVYAIHETIHNTMLVETELFAGDLRQVFNVIPRHMRANAARSALAQQAQQLDGLHASGYMHRDVKSENTLFGENGVVQVADPGLAKKVDPDVVHGCTGTHSYMAPEVLNVYSGTAAAYGTKVDTWSLGVVACESLVRGIWPLLRFERPVDKIAAQGALIRFRATVLKAGKVNIQGIAARKNDGVWEQYFHQLALADKDLCRFILGRMLDPNPATRATMQEVITAANSTSLPAKVRTYVRGADAAAAFTLAARANSNYRREVDKLTLRGQPAPLDARKHTPPQ